MLSTDTYRLQNQLGLHETLSAEKEKERPLKQFGAIPF